MVIGILTHKATPASILLFLSLSLVAARKAKSEMSRVAVVTGANKGIGYHIGLQLASSGLFSNVVLGCRDGGRGQHAAQQITNELQKVESSLGCEVSYETLTIGDRHSHASFCKKMQERFGKVDVLVNNAGTAFKGSDPTPFEGQCRPTLDVNFRGTCEFTEEMLPLVRRGKDPRIVNVASMAGRLGQIRSKEIQRRFVDPNLSAKELYGLVDQFESDVMDGTYSAKGWGNSNYGMSKLALIAMTRILAREEAENGIKVNSCCPGYCDTDMTSHRGSRSASEGARNAVLPATMEDVPTAEYFRDFEVAHWG